MLIRKTVVAIAVLALLLGTFAVTSYVTAAKAKGPTYEYLIQGKRLIDRSVMEGGERKEGGTMLMSEFNFQGGEGWEYVGCIPGKGDAYFCVFKRQK